MIKNKLIGALGVILVLAAGFSFAGSDAPAGDATAGETKAAGCIGCHGADGAGQGDNPAVNQLSATDHYNKLKGYQSGEIASPMMQMFTADLSDQDLADIAAYFAAQGK